MGQVFRRNTSAGVYHWNRDAITIGSQPYRDIAAIWCVTEGVAEEIKSQRSVLGLRNNLFSFKTGLKRHLKSQQSGGRIISFPHYLLT